MTPEQQITRLFQKGDFMKTRTRIERKQTKSPKFIFTILLWVTCAFQFGGCVTTAINDSEPKDIPILQKWNGDYPVTHLNRLPDGKNKSPVGYIGDAEIFAAVWQAFRPNEKVPEVDFSKNFAVYSRNIEFYNRTSIVKITLKGGVVEILAMETMSALPIEDKVAIALAVIPRVGVKFIQTGNEKIPMSNNN
jgi:hypothetical protein